jgi:hypothetical protein
MSGIMMQFAAGSYGPTVTPAGQQTFTTPGSFSWIAPTGVTSVSVVCVGGGGGGSGDGFGGGGGGLGYKNNISVTPGDSYTVRVGSRGIGGQNGTSGDESYFINDTTVNGKPGRGQNNSGAGGSFIGDGCRWS